MRGIGLLALLLGVAIMFYMMFGSSGEVATVTQASKKATEQVEVMAGKTDDGRKCTDTITYEVNMVNGKINGVLIKTVEAGGAMQKMYGFIPGDLVTEFPPEGLAKDIVTSDNDAYTLLFTCYQSSRPLVITRNGRKLNLPSQRNEALTPLVTPVAAPSPVAAPVTPTPAAQPPAPAKEPRNNNIYKQANDLRNKIETH